MPTKNSDLAAQLKPYILAWIQGTGAGVQALQSRALALLANWARGMIIRGGATNWEVHDAKTVGFLVQGDGTDVKSAAFDWDTVAAATGADVVHTHDSDAEGGALEALGHDAVTLDGTTHADDVLGLTGQLVTLDSQTANTVLAGPATGAAAAPTFRALVAADISIVPEVTLLSMAFWGDGADGDVVHDDDENPLTLTRDMRYHDFTIASDCILYTNGFRIFCTGTLTNNGTISNIGDVGGNGGNGGSGAGGTAGTAGTSGKTSGAGSLLAMGGRAGRYTSGYTVGLSGNACNSSVAGLAGADAGDGDIDPGATGGLAGGAALDVDWHTPFVLLGTHSAAFMGLGFAIVCSAAGSGGAGGGGRGTNGGGGGGAGGGGNGGNIIIASKTIVNAGEMTVAGGDGGTGGNGYDATCGGGGGGVGGNGGVIALIYETFGTRGTLTIAHGHGGFGGTGYEAGATGSDGNAGELFEIDV